MTQPVKFGLNVDPNTGGLPIAERITAIADASGLDLVGIQDHPYNNDFTDTLTLITWLAAKTRHVHLFPNVANLPLRPPAMLAKQAATIDVLSGGRFELGLGAGAATGNGNPACSPSKSCPPYANPSPASHRHPEQALSHRVLDARHTFRHPVRSVRSVCGCGGRGPAGPQASELG
jgi:hypothetical protein